MGVVYRAEDPKLGREAAPQIPPGANRPSDSVLPITGRLHRRSARRPKSPHIPHRRLPEQPAVFAVELAGAFVSGLKGRTGSGRSGPP
jgi:hypothetical protein